MARHVHGHLLVNTLTLLSIIWLSPSVSSSDRPSARKRGINSGLRVNMFRREFKSNVNMTLTDRIARAVERSKKRQLRIQNIIARKDPETPVHAGNTEFLMNVGVGNPAVSFDAIVDTASDLIWTQCQPCVDCYKQPTPIFDPSKSSSYAKVPCNDTLCQALGNTTGCTSQCNYIYEYGDLSVTMGVLSYDMLTFGDGDAVGHIAFGCGYDNAGVGFEQGGGIVGLGRGPLSLVSQLGSKVQSRFSYCLVPFADPPSKTSPLFFGASAELGSGAKSVPLIRRSTAPTFYYLPVEGISVGGSLLDIPSDAFDMKPDGTGGFLIDSGTTITFLEDAAYRPLVTAFQSGIDLPPADGSSVGLDVCYNLPSNRLINPPTLAFHFEGGVDYELLADNYFLQVEIDGNNNMCLAILGSSAISILGNIQQQNFHILFDNARNTLSFLPAACDTL